MLQANKRNTNIGVGLGWLLSVLGNVLRQQQYPPAAYLLVFLAAVFLFLWGCSQYAKGKGYSGWWGALGVLYLLGLLVLVLMPDRHKQG